MNETLIYLEPDSPLSLQNQIRQKLVEAILNGAFPPACRLPSSRKLAEQLGVARNTVVLAYEQLIEEEFLESRERSGIYVNEIILKGRVSFQGPSATETEKDSEWRKRIRTETSPKPQFRGPATGKNIPIHLLTGISIPPCTRRHNGAKPAEWPSALAFSMRDQTPKVMLTIRP